MPALSAKLKDLARPLSQPAWLCFLWLGLTAGISLLESPLRFTVATLPREAAFDLGQVVFNALNTVELVLLLILAVLVGISGNARQLRLGFALLALMVAVQSIWLLPELTERAAMVVAGIDPPVSIVHRAYVTTEITKLLTLFWLGLRSLRA